MDRLRQSSTPRKPELSKTIVAAAISAIIASGCSLITKVDRELITEDHNTTSQPEGGGGTMNTGGTVNPGGNGGIGGTETGGGGTMNTGGNGGTGGTETGGGGTGGTVCQGGPATVTIEDEAGSYQIRTISNNGASSSTAGCTAYTQNSIASLGGQPNDKLIIGDDDGFFSASWPEPVCLNMFVACYTDANGPTLPNPPCMSSTMGTWPTNLTWTNLGSIDSATATTGFSYPITCPDDQFAWMMQQ